jgi:alpha-glucosidase
VSRPAPWWREGLLYEVYVRSFADSNGDGIGDLAGVRSRLEHLAWLGVDGIWLSPIVPSPNADWGYDVSDYMDVDPVLGDLEEFDRLVADANQLGIRVLVDLVPNHTSDRHPWFLESRASRESPRRTWYVWADSRAPGEPPNNWMSEFGGRAWCFDDRTKQWYLHNFLPEQPDLNWWEPGVSDAFDEILRFWLDRGAAGFRIDVTHGIVKDRQLRDNPPATADDPETVRRTGQRRIYSSNRPEGHDVLRGWRALADLYGDDRFLIGETFVFDVDRMASYYGTGSDELHAAFNFPFALSPFRAEALRDVVAETERAIPADGLPVWAGSNHDIGRFPTRWCDGDEDRIRCALLALLTLRGKPVLYYGDEIGMTERPVEGDAVRDPLGKRWPERGRDPARTPMQWSPEPEAGFADAGVEPWLPAGDPAGANVRDQRIDPGSVLNLCRDLATLRRRSEDLRTGAYTALDSPRETWVWRRGEGATVALNLSSKTARLDAIEGSVAISTRRDRDGEQVARSLDLRPWEGVVVVTA